MSSIDWSIGAGGRTDARTDGRSPPRTQEPMIVPQKSARRTVAPHRTPWQAGGRAARLICLRQTRPIHSCPLSRQHRHRRRRSSKNLQLNSKECGAKET